MENDSSGKAEGRIMKRRMIAVLLSGILLCSAAGCGKEAVTDKSTAASSSQEVTETPAAEESPEASSSSADSTAESASASTSESSGDEGKEADKKRIEITVPHKDGMEALYDTVDGLTVEKGSYIAVVAKDLSAGFWKAVKAGAQQALDLNASLGYTGNDKVYMTFEGPENESDTNSQINIIDSVIRKIRTR